MNVENNKADREHAAEVFAMCGDARPRFWEELNKLVQTKLPPSLLDIPPSGRKPFSRIEAMAFEKLHMSYGIYVGVPVAEVPAHYLNTIAYGNENFRRYLESDYFKSFYGEVVDEPPPEFIT